jgi:N-dimethylarginine dimethylaminohydrolase
MINILVCDPSEYNVTYSINPWMQPDKVKIDKRLAIEQWHGLVNILKKLNVKVSVMPGQPGLPDMVFTANAGLVIPNKNQILLSNFKHSERKSEKKHYKEWFESNGFESMEFTSEFNFEGAGDGLFDDNILYLGYGFRSDYDCVTHSFWDGLWQGHTNYIELVDPYFYHLDTCFCPLQSNFALIWEGAFDSNTIKNEFDELELLMVPEEDALKFACNAVVIGNKVIIPSGCEKTKKLLLNAAFEVFETDMSEFIKAGGACKCLTLKLN